MTNAAMNIDEHSFVGTCFISLGYIYIVVELLGYVEPLEKLPDFFPKQLHYFTILLAMHEAPISPHPCQHWLLSVFLIIAILVGVK